MKSKMITIEGNTAASTVAHATNEVIAIYPITPSSQMGEIADALSAAGQKNIWGTVPIVTEMQSEAGAVAAVHGALSAGSLCTTFTASQGLLLMIPTMFKIAGELLPTVFHVSARSIACQALSIFGDHSDVMATRSTGFGLVCSNSVQEVLDTALIAQATTLEARVPMIHFFDGFRTSSEIQKVEELTVEDMRAMINQEFVERHKRNAMSPDHPIIRGTSQNPDVYFQARETVNPFYQKMPEIMEKNMEKFAGLTGRRYHLFDYVGDPRAEHVVVMMGSGAETMHEVVEYLNNNHGEKVGLIKVRLFRPFSIKHLASVIPATVKKISVLDRTKEPGAPGEPLYVDVRSAIGEAMHDGILRLDHGYPKIYGGRYGLSSKEFTSGMAKAAIDNMKKENPKNHFTVGIVDDVTNTSLEYDENFFSEPADSHRAVFYGLGADGTVGANKNSIKIIGKATDFYAQGYFVYDSKKAGAVTVSHLRFGKNPIRSIYLVYSADFVACHNFTFLEKYDMLSVAKPGAVFLLASPFNKNEIWDQLPAEVQEQIITKKLRFYVIDALKIARDLNLGARINTIMQTGYFVISGVLPREKAIELIKDSIIDTYSMKGQKVVDLNIHAVETAVKSIEEVAVPDKITSKFHMRPPVPENAPEFVKNVIGEIITGRGDKLPVSLLPPDGSYPTATTQFEKRNIAVEIPVWEPDVCIQCGHCCIICPHAAIRMKIYDPSLLKDAPATFKSVQAKGKEFQGLVYTLQVAPEDCTGCGNCVYICPSYKKDDKGTKTERKAINLSFQIPLRKTEAANYEFFLSLPELDRSKINPSTVKGSQLLRPLFEYSGACSGCGETGYVKLLTQLFGDRALIGNATGCSSIYGGNLPTTPYCKRSDGRGPTWNNSLFEDTAELAYGMRLSMDKANEFALELVEKLKSCNCGTCASNTSLFEEIQKADQTTLEGIEAQRERVAKLKKITAAHHEIDVHRWLDSVADNLVKRSIWGVGGDGWAYDIGYGGLDHVLASNKNVNLLVLDTEVYSNTGGQASKSTPLGAVAKFAAGGKPITKKDLGMIAISYGHIYVAQIALGANLQQAVKAFIEAESYDGPSIIIAYCPCIAHGIDMTKSPSQAKLAVDSGMWILYRHNPLRLAKDQNPLIIDSKPPSLDLAEYLYSENRFRILQRERPQVAEELLMRARIDVKRKYRKYDYLSKMEMVVE